MDSKGRILKAFKEMARLQGIHAIKMDDLARVAGLSKRTLYIHFKSKEDLVEKALDSFLPGTILKVEQLASHPNFLENLSKTISAILHEGVFLLNIQSLRDLQTYYPELWNRWNTHLIELITTILNAILNITNKKWVAEMDPRLIREAILAIERRFITPEFALEMGISMEEVALNFAKLVTCSYL
jgi:AcrR family transcriptional regulator